MSRIDIALLITGFAIDFVFYAMMALFAIASIQGLDASEVGGVRGLWSEYWFAACTFSLVMMKLQRIENRLDEIT